MLPFPPVLTAGGNNARDRGRGYGHQVTEIVTARVMEAEAVAEITSRSQSCS
jgi:hypothetical protein